MNPPTPALSPSPKRWFGLSTGSAVALLVLALAAAGMGVWRAHTVPAAPTVAPRVTIALPTQLNSATMIVASSRGLFREAGVDVVTKPFLLGKDALQSVLDGEADMALVADVPFIFARLGGKDVAILASVSRARRALAIVARKDRGIARMQDLQGKSIGLTMGTNFTYFADAMLQVNRVATDKVQLVDLKVDDAIDSFKAGRVDAAVVFQPYLARLQAEMGTSINVFYGEDVYAFRFLLVAKPAYIDSHSAEIRRVLSALVAANESIKADPVSARQAVGQVVKIDELTMGRLFDPDDYQVSLDEAMLIAMDDQTRWAMKRGLVPAGPVPNFLELTRHQDLKAVQPKAVQFSH